MLFLKKHLPYAPYLLLATLIAFTVGVWVLVYAQTPSGLLKVAMMDVGQGDSIYIESPTGVQVVVDGGPDNAILRRLPHVMPPLDRSLDVLVETHPDADHFAGFVDVLKRYSIGAFVEPGIVKTSQTAKTVEAEVLERHISRYIARRGMVLDLGGGAQLEVIYPDHDVEHINQKEDNDGGLVTRLTYGSTTVLFMADVSEKVENDLVGLEGQKLKATILKVGHHGSKTSSGEAFLALVKPKEALISVGTHNPYHHPTEEALSRLADVGAEVLRTDQEGTLEFASDGYTFWRVK